MPLWVLGMHRSGTSFLVRCLHSYGVELPPNLLPSAADNPDGFQESADFVALNEAVLASQGSLWDGAWHLSNSVEMPPTAAGVAREARRLINSWCNPLAMNAGAPTPLLALKDPRLCRTMPALLDALGSDWFPWGLAIVRHPFSVVRSIGYRDNMHATKALALWLRHNLELLQLAKAGGLTEPWPLICFERLIVDPTTELSSVLESFRAEGFQLSQLPFNFPRLRQLPVLPNQLEAVDPAFQHLALRFYRSLKHAATLGSVDQAIQDEVNEVLDGNPRLSQQLLAIETQRRDQLCLALAKERRGHDSPKRLLGEEDILRLEERLPLASSSLGPAYVELKGVCVDLRGREHRRSLKRLLFGQTASGMRPLALDHLDLRIDHGERIALLGHNGSGKSTLLRLLGGIYEHTAGNLLRDGDPMSPIITESLGYSLELTGVQLARHHHLLNRFRSQNWQDYLAEIEAFTELGKALYTPIKTWSIGMRTRLSFALITFREVRGLALDEGLAAGDQWFQRKAKAHLDAFIEAAGTLVLASHSTDLLQRYCSRGVILERGSIIYDGTLYRALQLYQSLV